MDPDGLLVTIVGWTGVVLYVVAYCGVSIGMLDARARPYQALNLCGAFGVALNAYAKDTYPALAVNVIWFLIATVMLARPAKASDELDPAHPEAGRRVHGVIGVVAALAIVFGLGYAILEVAGGVQSSKPIRVVTSNWEPYVGRDLEGGGPLVVLARSVFRRAGYEPVFTFADDFERAQQLVADRQVAASLPYIATDERRARFALSAPFFEFDYVLFHRDDGSFDARRFFSGDTPADAAPRFGRVRGYQLWDELHERGVDDSDVAVFDSVEEAFAELADGEIDVVVESRVVGRAVLADPEVGVDAEDIVWTDAERDGEASVSREDLHVVVHPSGHELVAQLGAAIEAIGDLRLAEARAAVQRSAEGEHTERTRVRMRRVADAFDEGGAQLRLAPGVEAVVWEWPAGFDGAGGGRERCRVKIATGPLQGRMLSVDPDAVEVVRGDR